MDQEQKLLREIWRWLPLFRLVAETESITRASEAFEVTPPSVSRALAQVEEALGRKLFDRAGRRLSLNPDGRVLLASVEQAQSIVQQVIDDLSDLDAAGHVRLATIGQLGRVFLAPAMHTVLTKHPRLEVSIVHIEPDEAIERLNSRTLDLYLALNVAVSEPLHAARLAELEVGIYAGRGHRLFGKSGLTLEEITAHPFAAQIRPRLMRSVWPAATPRKVTLQTDSHALALESCLSGSHLMAMERVIAEPMLKAGQLFELNHDALPPARLVLCRRADRGRGAIANLVHRAITETVRDRLKQS
jgi:DNA-binding transcriptional LysR family regulator